MIFTKFISIAAANCSFGDLSCFGNVLFNAIAVFLLKLVFSLVEFAYKIFEIAYTINPGTISGFLQGLLNRITALIIVVVIYNMASTIIKLMSKGDAKDISNQSAEIIKNVFITAALLIGYNLFFGLLNELSLLAIGNKVGYDYPILSQIITVDKSEDSGIITRLMFGDQKSGKIGNILSCGLYTKFTIAGNCSNGFNFNAWQAADEAIDPSGSSAIEPFWPLGVIIGGYMAYYIFKAAIAIISRVFKLTLLQIAAPIPIASIILEGTGANSKFRKFCSSYLSVFSELFVRVITMLVVCAVVVNFDSFLSPFADAASNVSMSETNNRLVASLYIPEVGEQVDQQINEENYNNENNYENNDNYENNENNENGMGDDNKESSENSVDSVTKFCFYGILAVGALIFANEAPGIFESVFNTSVGSSLKGIGSGIVGGIGGLFNGLKSGTGLLSRAGSGISGAIQGYKDAQSKGEQTKNLIDSYNQGKAKGIGAGQKGRDSWLGDKENRIGSAMLGLTGKDKQVEQDIKEKEELGAENEKLEAENETAQGKIAKAESDKANAQSRINSAQAKIDRLNDSNSQMEELNDRLVDISNAEQRVADLQAKFEGLAPDSPECDAVIDAIEAAQNDVSTAIHSYEVAGGQVESDGSVKVDVRQAELNRSITANNKEIAVQTSVIDSNQTIIDNADTVINESITTIETNTQKYADNTQRITQLDDEITKNTNGLINQHVYSKTREKMAKERAEKNKR